MKYCRYCQSPDAKPHVTTGGIVYACDSCYTEYFTTCTRCGAECDVLDVNGEGICNLCAEQELFADEEEEEEDTYESEINYTPLPPNWCIVCRQEEGDPVNIQGKVTYMCDSCYNKRFTFCTICGLRIERELAHDRMCDVCYKNKLEKGEKK